MPCGWAAVPSKPIARRCQPIVAQPIHKEAPPDGLSRFFGSLASLNPSQIGRRKQPAMERQPGFAPVEAALLMYSL
jgi:hypothetical protein